MTGSGAWTIFTSDPPPRQTFAEVPALWKTAAEGTSISDDLAGIELLHARDPHALLIARRDGGLVEGAGRTPAPLFP